MTVYDFTFVVDADPHSEDFEDRFIEAGCDDATFILMRGAAAVSFDREADCYKTAVSSAYKQVMSTGAQVVRFEPDFLVSPSEISARSGLTRSSIGLYIKGARREGFPPPKARISSNQPLWDWVEVSKWLVAEEMLPEERYTEALISRIINAGSQLMNAIPGSNLDLEGALASV